MENSAATYNARMRAIQFASFGGLEVAGVVDELGDGITDVNVGDEVFGSVDGGNGAADFALLAHYARIPPSLDFAGAAGLPVAVETATRTLALLDVGAALPALVELAGGPEHVVTIADYQGAQETGVRMSGGADSPRVLLAG